MPIKFRCSHCRQFLGISPSRAGQMTDCPTCGRTVRVPNLDGSVTPVPKAGISLADSQLVRALSTVSRIGSVVEDADDSPPVAVNVAKAESEMVRVPELSVPTAVAEPAVPVLEPEPVIPLAGPTERSQSEMPPHLFADFEAAAAERPTKSVRRRSQTAPELQIVGVALAAIAIFIAGFLAGRFSSRPAAATEAANVPAAQQDAGPAANAAAVADAAAAAAPVTDGVYGQVTYSMAGGSARPDGGTRVLAVPVERPEGLPLATSGFRAGAAPTVRNQAQEALRSIGGAFSVANAQGQYSLPLSAGEYDVLFLSRHRPREAEAPLDADVQEVLDAYFDQPAGLIGSIAVQHKRIEFGGKSLSVDCEFTQ